MTRPALALAPLYVVALLALYWPPTLRAVPGDFCGGASAAVVQQRTLQALSGMGVAAERAMFKSQLPRHVWADQTPKCQGSYILDARAVLRAAVERVIGEGGE